MQSATRHWPLSHELAFGVRRHQRRAFAVTKAISRLLRTRTGRFSRTMLTFRARTCYRSGLVRNAAHARLELALGVRCAGIMKLERDVSRTLAVC